MNGGPGAVRDGVDKHITVEEAIETIGNAPALFHFSLILLPDR